MQALVNKNNPWLDSTEHKKDKLEHELSLSQQKGPESTYKTAASVFELSTWIIAKSLPTDLPGYIHKDVQFIFILTNRKWVRRLKLLNISDIFCLKKHSVG